MNNTPECIGVIIDGNRRWAHEKGLSTAEGHRAGYENVKKFLEWAKEFDIKNIIIYAFSTENWNRTEEEVGSLMKLFEFFIEKEISNIIKEEFQVVFIGDRLRFSEKLQKGMKEAEQASKGFERKVIIALSYGGRDEILRAVKSIPDEERGSLTEKDFAAHLFTKDIPDPDFIIRTGGEKRLSNFLLWQTAYSELFFTDTLWPDFSKDEFKGILEEYEAKDRRHGK